MADTVATSSSTSASNEQPGEALTLQVQELLGNKDLGGPQHQQLLRQSLSFLFSKSDHWFCEFPDITGLCLHLFSIEESATITRFKNCIRNQLDDCSRCTQKFCRIIPKLKESYGSSFETNAFDLFFETIDSWNKERITNALRTAFPYLSNRVSGGDVVVEATEIRKASNCAHNLLIDHRLLESADISQPFFQFLKSSLPQDVAFRIDEMYYPGTFLLAIHNDAEIRLWAINRLSRANEKIGVEAFVEHHLAEAFEIINQRYQTCTFEWAGVAVSFASLSTQTVKRKLRACAMEMGNYICRNISNEQLPTPDLVSTLHSILKALGSDFWQLSNLGSSGLARQTLLGIISSHSVRDWILSDDNLNTRCSLSWIDGFVNSFDIPHAETYATSDNQLPAKTLAATFTKEIIIGDIVSFLFSDVFQEEARPAIRGLTMVLAALQSATSPSSASIKLLDSSADALIRFASKQEENMHDVKALASKAIIECVKSDITNIQSEDDRLRSFTDGSSPNLHIPRGSLIRESLWLSLCEAPDPLHMDISVHAHLISCWTSIAYCSECVTDDTTAGDQISDARTTIKGALATYMHQLGTLPPELASELFRNLLSCVWTNDVLKGLCILMSDSDTRLRKSAQRFVGVALKDPGLPDENDAPEFFIPGRFITKYTLHAIIGYTEALNQFSELTRTSSNTLMFVPPMTGTIINVLRVLRDEGALSRTMKSGVDLSEVMETFWGSLWHAVATLVVAAVQWAKQWTEEPKALQVLRAATLAFELADACLASRKMFHSALEIHPGRKLQHEHVHMCLSKLIRWLSTTNDVLRGHAVQLVCGIIRLLALCKEEADTTTKNALETAATGGKRGEKLDEAQRGAIFIALTELDVDVILVDSDDEDEEAHSMPAKEVARTVVDSTRSVKRGDPHATSLEAEAVGDALDDSFASEISDDEYEYGDMGIDDDALLARWEEYEANALKEYEHQKSNKSQAPHGQNFGRTEKTTEPKKFANFADFARSVKNSAFASNDDTRKRPTRKLGSKLKELRREQLLHHNRIQANIAEVRKQHVVKAANKGSSESEISDDSDEDATNGIAELAKQDVTSEKRKTTCNLFSMPVPKAHRRPPEVRRTIKMIDTPGARKGVDIKKMKARDDELQRARIAPNLSNLHRKVLSWSPDASGDIPPTNGTEIAYKSVPETFRSSDEFVSIFEPLLVLECWQQLQRALEETSPVQDSLEAKCTNRAAVDNFQDVTYSMAVGPARTLVENDLVRLVRVSSKPGVMANGIPIVASGNSSEEIPILGKVNGVYSKGSDLADVEIRVYVFHDKTNILLTINPGTTWKILKLCSLVPIHREYAALKGMRYFGLCHIILNPKASASRPPQPSAASTRRCMDGYGVNEPQAVAIQAALEKPEGFTLIQGPPGTGKTKTILGLVGALMSSHAPAPVRIPGSKSMPSSSNKHRILVCAPSNAAVDEIVKRLKFGILNSNGSRIKPNIVRIGQADAMNEVNRDVSLEVLVEKLLTSDAALSNANGEMRAANDKIEKLRETKKAINRTIDDVRSRLEKNTTAELETELKELNKKRYSLNQELESEKDRTVAGRHARDAARRNAKNQVLIESDLVCCTLSGSGNEILSTLPTGFETVIIDEAAQSVELSSLIPLKYGCRRCILVGDPNQLPPTVLSQVASQYSYNQSMFVRMQKLVPDQVHLLSIQYRMHPQISAFPSRLFYESKLMDGPNLETIKSQVWHGSKEFSPFRFFNVVDGTATAGRGHSLYNTVEAEIAMGIVDRLCVSYPDTSFFRRIGIITPYKQQLRELKRVFTKRYGRSVVSAIDFNTVDGFQGQEKDVIIFSCVRGGSANGIGFLADVRRMNVALTRARNSLFVLGNANALACNRMWRTLLDDAVERNVMMDVTAPFLGKPLSSKQLTNLLSEEDVKEVDAPPKPVKPVPSASTRGTNLEQRSTARSTSSQQPNEVRNPRSDSRGNGSVTEPAEKDVPSGRTLSSDDRSRSSPRPIESRRGAGHLVLAARNRPTSTGSNSAHSASLQHPLPSRPASPFPSRPPDAATARAGSLPRSGGSPRTNSGSTMNHRTSINHLHGSDRQPISSATSQRLPGLGDGESERRSPHPANDQRKRSREPDDSEKRYAGKQPRT